MVETSINGIDLNVTPFHKTADDTNNINDDNIGDQLNNIMSLENKKLKEKLTLVLDNNSILQNHLNKLRQDHDLLASNSVKRKSSECDHEVNGNDHQGPLKRPNNGITTVYRRTDPSDHTMVVKDGYEWRKYGQKVTRDNPSPRAYYKCSFAPSCPVKKKVQRSVNDACLLVVIYEGEHNHESPENEHLNPTRNKRLNPPMESEKFDEILVEKMAKSLRKNSDFMENLADAIFWKVFEHININLPS